MASWCMGRISVYKTIQKLVDCGVYKAAQDCWRTHNREMIREDAKYLVRLYRDYVARNQ